MAKPIEATPILRGKDARRFLERMKKEEENPDPRRIDFIRESIKQENERMNRVKRRVMFWNLVKLVCVFLIGVGMGYFLRVRNWAMFLIFVFLAAMLVVSVYRELE